MYHHYLRGWTYTVNEGLPTAFLQGRSLVETDVLFGMFFHEVFMRS